MVAKATKGHGLYYRRDLVDEFMEITGLNPANSRVMVNATLLALRNLLERLPPGEKMTLAGFGIFAKTITEGYWRSGFPIIETGDERVYIPQTYQIRFRPAKQMMVALREQGKKEDPNLGPQEKK